MRKIGTFYTQDWLERWWTIEDTRVPANTLIVNKDMFADGMTPVLNPPKLVNDYQIIYPNTSINVNAGGYYTLTMKMSSEIWEKQLISDNAQNLYDLLIAQLDVYVSGSGVAHLEPQGKKIKSFENIRDFNYEEISIDFETEFAGEITPILKVNAGKWIFADVSITLMQEQGFSPTQYVYYTEIPTWARNDDLDFKVELYDVDGNKAPSDVQISNIPFSGSNLYIEGDDNVQPGSIYIGQTAQSGIETSGRGSAYIRSVGYKGWDSASFSGSSGFMMFSGSVLSEEDQVIFEDYQGVGLELHDGKDVGTSSYLRFRTDPSILEVATDTFFFGRENMMYISGSGGLIEISSSNFLLSSSGDVFISGSINATSGSIGGWEIGETTLYAQVTGVGGEITSSIYLDAGDNTIRLHSGSDNVLVMEMSGDVIEDKTDHISSFGLYGQDATIFLKRESFEYPHGGVKAGVDPFTQNGTRVKPGFLHLQGSGSSSEDWQRLASQGSNLTVLSYNQNVSSSITPDITYGINVVKETGVNTDGGNVQNIGVRSSVGVASTTDTAYAIYGSIASVMGGLDKNGYAGYFNGKAKVAGSFHVDGWSGEPDIAIFGNGNILGNYQRLQVRSRPSTDAQVWLTDSSTTTDGWTIGSKPDGLFNDNGFHIKSGSGEFNSVDTLIVNDLGMSVRHNPTTLTDDIGMGDIVTFGTIAGAIDTGELLYLRNTGNWYQANASNTLFGSKELLGISLGKAVADGIMIKGYFNVDTYWTGSFTPGQPVYADTGSYGKFSIVKPSDVGHYVRVVGYCTDTANVIYFNPSSTYLGL